MICQSNFLPSAEDLDAVAEEERVRLATSGGGWQYGQPRQVSIHCDAALESLKLMARGAGVALLVDAAERLARMHLCLGPPKTSDQKSDEPQAMVCNVCLWGALTGFPHDHAESCPVGHVFRAIAALHSLDQKPVEPARPLVTGHAEREIVLDPVEHPTPEELA